MSRPVDEAQLLYLAAEPLGSLLAALPGGQPEWRPVWRFGVREGKWAFAVVPHFMDSCTDEELWWIETEQPLNFQWWRGRDEFGRVKRRNGSAPGLSLNDEQRPQKPLGQRRTADAASAAGARTSSRTSRGG